MAKSYWPDVLAAFILGTTLASVHLDGWNGWRVALVVVTLLTIAAGCLLRLADRRKAYWDRRWEQKEGERNGR